MLLHIALVMEILATFICIHCIYGRRVEIHVKMILAFLSILIVLEIINNYQLNGIFSFLVYIILFLYCKTEFKSLAVEIVISLLLYIIVLTSMQFICLSLVNIVIPQEELFRNVVGNALILAICGGILSKCGLHRLQESLHRKSKYVMAILGFMCLIVMIMLLQGKIDYEVQMQYFVLAVPAIIMLLYSISKWYTAQTRAEKMEEEIHKAEENTKECENLLTKVRLRQHEFKNHIEAIFSAHYTYKTYENLVQAQEEYCKKLLDENKYNDLLLLGNNILVGYLYRKFQEAEEDGIEINYIVTAKLDKVQVPIYYVVEMLGILFDNAVEALKKSTQKIIFFEVCESRDEYEFSIRNPFHYVSYDEISGWFQFGNSEKGNGRGLGLYHLKCLCDEWQCDIICKNIEFNKNNWIVFTLKMRKADNK